MHVDPFDRYHYALLVFHSKLGKWSRMELDLDLGFFPLDNDKYLC